MALEPGGRADKLAGEYERLFGVWQACRVLSGEAVSLLSEGLGPDEKGVDYWVLGPDGTRIAFQCKAANGQRGQWSVGDLAREKILANAVFQLGRAPEHRYALVSADHAPCLEDLPERTHDCNNDPEYYLTHSVRTSEGHAKAFDQLCGNLNYNPQAPDGLRNIFDFLQRFEIIFFQRGRRGREFVRTMARSTIDGDPDDAIRVLEACILGNIGNEVHADVLRDTLRDADLVPRNLSGLPEVHQGIDALRERYKSSLILINDELIQRPEAQALLEAVVSGSERKVICVHGRAGEGKSGVLFEAVKELESRHIPCLPLRLDRMTPIRTPHWFGRDVCGLPASPASCLKAVAGKRIGVLVLDQLDALRWTSAGNHNAWDVCADLIEEALQCQSLRVVVACRTFDLEEDPRFERWKREHEVTEIKVGPLPRDAVRRIVTAAGGDWDSLTERQKSLLASAQNLDLYVRLRKQGLSPQISNSVGLMRAYWQHIRADAIPTASLSCPDAEHFVRDIVSHMDDHGCLSAPLSLTSRQPQMIRFFASAGVLRIDNGRILFSHQSHLDYLIAEMLLQEVFQEGKSVWDWLSNTEQSLFRRNQLRHILALLREDDHGSYVQTLGDLVLSDSVRFHLKHLALRFLGAVEEPSHREVDLVMELMENHDWREHVVANVLWNKAPWFVALARCGIVARWLGGESQDCDLALGMMGVVTAECGERIASLLKPFVTAPPPWPERVGRVLSMGRFEDESRALFAIRVKLLPRGVIQERWIDWKALAKLHPERGVLLFRVLLAALLRSYKEQNIPEASRRDLPELEGLNSGDIDEIAQMAQKVPRRAWSGLSRFILRRRSSIHRSLRRHHRYDGDRPFLPFNRARLPEVLWAAERVLCSAGQQLASRLPDEYLRLLEGSYARYPRYMRRAAIEALAGVPATHADEAIKLLCRCRSSFRLGRRRDESPWEPARKVIGAHAQNCSAAVLHQLELCVLSYRDRRVKRSFRHQQEGRFCNEMWRAQHVLLSAVPRDRLSPKTQALMHQWGEKFRDFPLRYGDMHTGGFVGSPIPSKVLPLVSDRQWLDIVQRDWRHRSGHWRQIGPDKVAEISHEVFARDMRHMAEMQPKRFAALAMKFHLDADLHYVREILWALARTTPPDGCNDVAWEPATALEIEDVLSRFDVTKERDAAWTFCHLIESRADAAWSDSTLEKLTWCAVNHPDPAPEEFSTHTQGQDGQMVADVWNSAFNCVRGGAAMAIQSLLFHHPGLLARLMPAIESLAEDASPAVRVAASSVALPLLNIDRELAVRYFSHVSELRDDRIFRNDFISRFISYTALDYPKTVVPIVERMASSSIPEVATDGAAWVAGIWVSSGTLKDALDVCLGGTVEQRKGVAQTAAHWLRKDEYEDGCLLLLPRLFSDANDEVRKTAATAFRYPEIFQRPGTVALVEAFVRNPAFADAADALVDGLADYEGELQPYFTALLDVVERICTTADTAPQEARRAQYSACREVFPLVLRLYEQYQGRDDKESQGRCLDAIDTMMRAQFGYLLDILDRLDE